MRQRKAPGGSYDRTKVKAQEGRTGFLRVVGGNFGLLVLSLCFVLDLLILFYVHDCFCLSV